MIAIVAAALAAARLVRAWNHEQIAEVAFDRVQQWANTPVMSYGRGAAVTVLNTRATVRRGYVGDLAACPHCLAVWVSIAMVVVYRTRVGRPVVTGLAASALVSAMVEHYPGWTMDDGDDIDG